MITGISNRPLLKRLLGRIGTIGIVGTALLAGCAANKAVPPLERTLSGIDVSHFQGEIDWPSVGGAGLHFVYIKASEGLHTTDPHLAINWAGARKQGLRTGPYHFFHPDEDATAQARHFLAQLDAAQIDLAGALPPVLDIEIAEGVKSETFRDDVLAWLTTVEQATGCTPILYTSPNFWAKEAPGKIHHHGLWLADYAAAPTVPPGWHHWTFWQHSQDGQVAGVPTKVDLTAFAGTEAELEALACRKR